MSSGRLSVVDPEEASPEELPKLSYRSSTNDSDFESDASSISSNLINSSDSDATHSNTEISIHSEENLNGNYDVHDAWIDDEICPVSSQKVFVLTCIWD